MNVRIFWVRVMKCMCAQTRPRFILSSKRVFWGNGVWTHVNSKGKIPSTGKFPQRRIKPATLWTASPNTTNELFRPFAWTDSGLWSVLFQYHKLDCALKSSHIMIVSPSSSSISSKKFQLVHVMQVESCMHALRRFRALCFSVWLPCNLGELVCHLTKFKFFCAKALILSDWNPQLYACVCLCLCLCLCVWMGMRARARVCVCMCVCVCVCVCDMCLWKFV